MDPLVAISVVCAFISGLAIVFAGVTAWRSFQASNSVVRLKDLVEGAKGASDAPSLLKESRLKIEEVSQSLRGIAAAIISLNNLFEQADVSLSTMSFLGVSFCTGFFSLVIAVLANVPAPAYLPIAVAGALSPLVWLLRRRQRRFSRFSKQLPEALQTLSRALRAGHSLNSAMNVVAMEMLPPISTEFKRACSEQALGRSVDECLSEMTTRIPNEDLQFLATSVKLQQRCGGNLAEILDKISAIVRERFRILGQVHALTGEGRLSGIILLSMPVAIFGVVYYLSPAYIEPLFRDALGRKMTAVAITLQLIGAFVIRQIVRIKV